MKLALAPLIVAAPCALPAPDTNESYFVDASLPVEGRLLAAEFADLDLDGRDEVVLAVRLPGGVRELRVHDFGAQTLARTPRTVLRVPTDAIAWAVADVRADAGREIVYLTRGGAFALSPSTGALRGNVARLLEAPLLYDVPDPLALPVWEYVVRVGERDWLLLPERDGYALYGPSATPSESTEQSLPYEARVRFSSSFSLASILGESERSSEESDREQARFDFDIDVAGELPPFIGPSSTTTLASDGRSQSAPALVDIDGDGRRDLLVLGLDRLDVHLGTAAGWSTTPSRTEALPAYLTRGGSAAALELVDADGDGRLDVLAVWDEDNDGFENVEWRVMLLLATKERLFPAEPNQVLRFEAANVSAEIGLVDGDARPDLVVRTFAAPGVVAATTGLTFEQTQLVYAGVRGGFDRKPLLKQTRTFDENGVREVIANRTLRLDLSGDGLGDLVEVALDGTVSIKRLRKESSFFSGTTWRIDETAWKSYATRGSVVSLEVRDLNGDGLGDIVSRAENGLTLLLSKRGGGQ
jgi:hypothetical protein